MNKFQDQLTQKWVKLTGQKINPEDHKWLIGPVGATDIIKDKFIYELALKEDLQLTKDEIDAGLLDSIEDIGISDGEKARLTNSVIDFYENTSNYNFEMWSEWKGLFRPFGGVLSILFSKRLQQLNLPLSSLDVAKGLKSEIIKLKSKEDKTTKWTIWYRKLKSSGDVIYSGIYTTCKNPDYKNPLLKVIFPLPNGNASVIMKKEVLEDGSLLLSSDGQKFGDNGFYFTLLDHNGQYWAKFVRAMHEWIKVYEDEENVLRADHVLNFYGFNFLKLHYKMTLRNSVANNV